MVLVFDVLTSQEFVKMIKRVALVVCQLQQRYIVLAHHSGCTPTLQKVWNLTEHLSMGDVGCLMDFASKVTNLDFEKPFDQEKKRSRSVSLVNAAVLGDAFNGLEHASD